MCEEILKRCPICKAIKPLSEYDKYWSKERNKYRPQNYCKACQGPRKKELSAAYYDAHKKERLEYASRYREKNKEIINKKRAHYRIKYRKELKDCYVRELLKEENDIPTEISREHPELVTVKRLEKQLKRTIKTLKNGKK